MKSNLIYIEENLENDDGTQWQLIFSTIIKTSNILELRLADSWNKSISEAMDDALEYMNQKGLEPFLLKTYRTNIMWQRQYDYHFIIGQFRLEPDLLRMISKFKTLLDWSIEGDLYDPAFILNDKVLLWSVTEQTLIFHQNIYLS